VKQSVNEFLELLEESVFETKKHLSKEYKEGVRNTIELAKVWFEDNNIIEFDVIGFNNNEERGE
jgi:hypothetical protein